jgi:hypothetical protein
VRHDCREQIGLAVLLCHHGLAGRGEPLVQVFQPGGQLICRRRACQLQRARVKPFEVSAILLRTGTIRGGEGV